MILLIVDNHLTYSMDIHLIHWWKSIAVKSNFDFFSPDLFPIFFWLIPYELPSILISGGDKSKEIVS